MSVIQFILAVIGVLGCLWAVNAYIAEAGIKMFGTIILIVILLVIVLKFCGVLGVLGA